MRLFRLALVSSTPDPLFLKDSSSLEVSAPASRLVSQSSRQQTAEDEWKKLDNLANPASVCLCVFSAVLQECQVFLVRWLRVSSGLRLRALLRGSRGMPGASRMGELLIYFAFDGETSLLVCSASLLLPESSGRSGISLSQRIEVSPSCSPLSFNCNSSRFYSLHWECRKEDRTASSSKALSICTMYS